MKSPAKLKIELLSAIENIRLVRAFLVGKSEEKIASIGIECAKTAETLQSILDTCKLPETYKVAVAGRFKAGKSSFVNELLDLKLAGEDTSPETAAVTTFVFGAVIEAKINFIDAAEWDAQKRLFQDDPQNIDAHRAKMWESFSKGRRGPDGNEEKFDLLAIERDLIFGGRGNLVISLDGSAGKAGEKAFRDKLKTFTSGNKPFHCLVKSINITAPSSILKDGIELIDTPGLGDTERFRVSLTEKSVEDVDAILLLTKSGVAYGQEEKDFLISVLRKGNVRQLMIVITQVDQTYDQHVKSARADDEQPQPVSTRLAIERRRITKEIEVTLQELSGVDTVVTKAYLEQFSSVDIIFTSVQAHRDFKMGGVPGVVLADGDPGGVIEFKRALGHVLSTESRLATVANQILGQSKFALESLATTLDAKLAAVTNKKNSEEVERRLNSFRSEFEALCKGVGQELNDIYLTFRSSANLRLQQHEINVENIVLRASKELNQFRTYDVAKHWRTRRSSNWGYFHDLQARVANRIFPMVQSMLEAHVGDFSNYVKHHELKLIELTSRAETIANGLDLGEFSGFDIKKQLSESTAKILESIQGKITHEQEKIVKFLDTFVSEEVEEKIAEKRALVSDIWGRGTSSAQQLQVNNFYDEIEALLSKALAKHVASRDAKFANWLVSVAEHAPKDTFREIDVQLNVTIENLRQVVEINLNGEKEYAERELSYIVRQIRESNSFNDGSEGEDSSERSEHVALVPGSEEEKGGQSADQIRRDWTDRLLNDCMTVLKNCNLRDGETGWSFSKIFEQKFFAGAQNLLIVEPHLSKYHQQRNLNELLLHVLGCSKPKNIEICTLPPSIEHVETSAKFFDQLGQSLFNDHGVTLSVEKSESLHDRYIFSDAGYVAKLGRGLDIYKPTAGLASHRQESRRVRACDITLFSR